MLGPRICDRCQVPLDDDEDLSICCNCFRRLCWVCSESCFRCAKSFCHNFCPCLCRVGALNRGTIDVTENEVRGYECASGGTLATNASGPHCDTVLCSLRKSRPSSSTGRGAMQGYEDRVKADEFRNLRGDAIVERVARQHIFLFLGHTLGISRYEFILGRTSLQEWRRATRAAAIARDCLQHDGTYRV